MPSLHETVTQLITSASSLDWQDKEGNSFLHLAVLERDTAVIQQLLECEVPRQSKNRWGMTPAELGKWLNYPECVTLIEPQSEIRISFQLQGEDTPTQYTPAQFKERTGVSYISHPFFESVKTLRRVVKLCAKASRRGWIDEEQLWLGALFRPEIEQGSSIPYLIRWVDEHVEYGLFATDHIPKDRYVGEYAGEIKKRSFWSFFQINDYCFRYPTARWGRPYFTINAQDYGSYTRYINHSSEPNLECTAVFCQGLFRLAFRALRPIEPGEQLCYDYGPYYWRHRPAPATL